MTEQFKPNPFTVLVDTREQSAFKAEQVGEPFRSQSRSKNKSAVFRCFCGVHFIAELGNVRQGKTRSCGCLKRGEFNHSAVIVDGVCSTAHPLYVAWRNMTRRATGAIRHYRNRGIKACSGLLNGESTKPAFQVFVEMMGPRPSKAHQIDRIDNSLHYSCGNCAQCHHEGWPMNCRWATSAENNQNRTSTRLTIDDVRDIRRRAGSETARALAAEYGVSDRTIGKVIRKESWTNV